MIVEIMRPRKINPSYLNTTAGFYRLKEKYRILKLQKQPRYSVNFRRRSGHCLGSQNVYQCMISQTGSTIAEF